MSGKRDVLATWAAGGEGGRSLILNGHVDVVPPAAEALWTNPPFEPVRRGDWLYGRGAGDMKAGLVAMAGAVRGLMALGVAPRAPVHLESVVEEECTGNGALMCVLRRAVGGRVRHHRAASRPHHGRAGGRGLGARRHPRRARPTPRARARSASTRSTPRRP